MQPERRADLEVLAESLRGADISVALDITEYEPGRRSVSLNEAEEVAIYIGGVASGAIITAFATDIYNRAKEWATARFRRNAASSPDGPHRQQRFIIYDQYGHVLRTWSTDLETHDENDDPHAV
jgi:hypothetical protein